MGIRERIWEDKSSNRSSDFDFQKFLKEFKAKNPQYPNIIDMTRFNEHVSGQEPKSERQR